MTREIAMNTARERTGDRRAHPRPHARGARAAIAVVALLAVARPARSAYGPPLTSRTGAVAADDPTASAVGAAVLGDGGNAMDAAVATVLALGVVNPTSSGIGGGGFAIVYDAASGQTVALDFREVAPAALDPGDFVRDGAIDPNLARRGGLAVGVPGEVAGLALMSQRFGRLSWRRVVAPSVRLARDGYATSWFFAQAAARVAPDLPDEPAYLPLRALLTEDGAPRRWGQPMARPALAATLAALATDPRALAVGPIADDIVATAAAAGGVLTAADLADYVVAERAPLRGSWHGLELATMPIPSSGGAVLLEALALLDRAKVDLPRLGPGSSAALHLIAEAAKHGFADRARALGDTDAGRAAAAAMLEPKRLDALARTLAPDHTLPSARYGEPAPVVTHGPGGTSHVCVIDRDGNAVSLTTTVNGYYGSKLVTAGGVVLNNQMDDFALAADTSNMFGLRQGAENLVGPGKRPLSSMTPVLVFEGGKVVGCVGGSGGPRIISNVLQVLLGMFAFDLDPRAAVGAPRVHHQWLPDVLTVEADLPADVRDGLTARGHTVVISPSPTAVQVLRVRPDGVIEAASDPRKNGAPAAPAR
ncbi:MAG: gamma-glutamyltransferase [Myxococcales bacterium]|nr:gamma-glutamyltransferase [Myxococcales bacterium]